MKDHNNTEFIKKLAFEAIKYNMQRKSTRVTPVTKGKATQTQLNLNKSNQWLLNTAYALYN